MEMMIIVSPVSQKTYLLEDKTGSVPAQKAPSQAQQPDIDLLLGRKDPSLSRQPDIDFTPDRGVSRQHARLFFKNDDWHIKDLSKNGTFLPGSRLDERGYRMIRIDKTPQKIEIGEPVRLGQNTLWTLANSTIKKIRLKNNLHIHFQLLPAINYAAARAGISLVRKLYLIDTSDLTILPFKTELRAAGYNVQLAIRMANPNDSAENKHSGDLFYPDNYQAFLKTNAKFPVTLSVDVDYTGGKVEQHYELPVDDFYEWRYDRSYRISLAAFVLYEDNLVKKLSDAVVKSEDAYQAVQAIYEYLLKNFVCHYKPPPNTKEAGKQRIRPPEKMITWSNGKGKLHGTCLDIALLFAACLEQMGYAPLIIIIQQPNNTWHALLGCWRQVDATHGWIPILNEETFRDEAGNLIFLETTTCTDRWQRPEPFKNAEERATEVLEKVLSKDRAYANNEEGKFIFALDVCAARRKVRPLVTEMPMDIREIYNNAERIAAGQGHKLLESRHLLLSMLYDRDESLTAMLEKAGGSRKKLEEALGKNRPMDLAATVPRQFNKSYGFKSAYSHAERLVTECRGAAHVDKLFLFYALILAGGKSIDRLLKKIDLSRYNLLTLLNGYFEIRCQGDISHSLDDE